MTSGATAMTRIRTGVPGFDAVLNGGIPELSFNLIAGGPGAGKTTLAQQILFANATPERPGLYFTVLGEPTLKMIRYQRQYTFFEPERVGTDIHLLNLSGEAEAGDLDAVLRRIIDEVERLHPGFVVVDSFRTLGPTISGADPAALARLEHFVQRLAIYLTTWEATSFLISEYADEEQRHPVFTVADGIFWLSQVAERNSVVRKLQIMKTRGQGFMPGLHTFRITESGLQVFPRIPEQQGARHRPADRRISTGVPGLDEMMGGGIPAGDAVMLAGPTGTGKTTIATQFLGRSHRDGEAVVAAVFEEYPDNYLARGTKLGVDLNEMVRSGKLRVIYLRPLDLSVDETLAAILDAVKETGATRVVIDSLSGFEIALAPAFREDFRESFYRLIGALTATGVTVLMTNEVGGPRADMSFTGERVSFITDDIIIQRYVEIAGELRTVLAVVKMRGSSHSREFREYVITREGAVIGKPLAEYRAIMTGFPERSASAIIEGRSTLTSGEYTVLETLMRLGQASVETLATRTGLPFRDIELALERLVALDYVIGASDGSGTYRATPQGVRP
jgi:circadian clock protein KaiC